MANEQTLWMAVVKQTFEDAVSKPTMHLTQVEIDQIRTYLLTSKELPEICGMADLDYSLIRTMAQNLKDQDWQAPDLIVKFRNIWR
jgi:hypothetical protein